MDSIKLTTWEERVYVSVPYCNDFNARAKEIGGRWDPSKKRWYFSIENKELLLKILEDVYGYCPENAGKAVTIRVKARDYEVGNRIMVGPIEAAQRYSRDSSVSMKNGAVVIQGKFPSSGGSQKNPCIESYDSEEEIILEIRDYPVMYLKQLKEDEYEIVEDPKNLSSLERQRDRIIGAIKELNSNLKDVLVEIEKLKKNQTTG